MISLKKFVAIGPESTGKSTLCQLLSEHYKTLWCREFAREYLLTNGNDYTYDNLLEIASGQIALEEKAIADSLGKYEFLFIDTDMYVMKVWCEFVFGRCHKLILDAVSERQYDGYLLCFPDLPWEADPLREYPDENIRKELFRHYFELLSNQSTPWCIIDGPVSQRLSKAVDFVERISSFGDE